MENVGKVEDERNEPLTLFNMIEESMPPFTDLVPIDDRNGELENITTTSDSLPYDGVGWEYLSRAVIAQIHAIFSHVE